MTISATFTSNGQTAEQDAEDVLGRLSSGHESKLAVQVSRTAGSSNFTVEVQAGFRDGGNVLWGNLPKSLRWMTKNRSSSIIISGCNIGCGARRAEPETPLGRFWDEA